MLESNIKYAYREYAHIYTFTAIYVPFRIFITFTFKYYVFHIFFQERRVNYPLNGKVVGSNTVNGNLFPFHDEM